MGGGPRVAPGAVLPDPKDKIALFGRIGEARALAKSEKFDDAVAAMRAVIAEDPGIIDAHIALGGWLAELKRPDEAIGAYRRALEIEPDNEPPSRPSPRRTARWGVTTRRSRATEPCSG